MARKSKYETHVEPFLASIPELCLSMNEKELAEHLGISEASLNTYKNEHPELREALMKGKRSLEHELKATLRRRALGYEYVEVKKTIRKDGGKDVVVIEETKKYSHPDVAAIHLLLKNIDPEWHNDDNATLEIKRAQLEIQKAKAEQEEWG